MFVVGVLVAVAASVPVGNDLLVEPAGASTVATPSPAVSAPPVGQHGFPFMSVAEHADLGHRGFVEDELFIEGTARSYVPDAPLADITDGRWNASPTGPTASYETRLLIRRPENPARFNGTVIVEWLNVSSGFDYDAILVGLDELLREGYAYVGVSAQAVGVNYLRGWETGDGARYATLEHPGDSYSYDIFSQAAQAILHPDQAGPAPLGNLTGRVDALVAEGSSQSGSRMITYMNAVHPTADLYDGFLPSLTNNGAALSQPPLPLVQPPSGAASRVRTDFDEPVLFLNSESEFVVGARGIHSQPDSEQFRLWELAGVAHAPGLTHLDEVRVAQFLASPGLEVTPRDCGPLAVNDIDQVPPFQAGLHAIRRWVRTGRAPVSAPRANLVIPGDPTQPATIARDPATGIAVGGIRMPDVAVPVRTLSGVRSPAALPPDNPGCFLSGSVDPWNGDSDPYDGDASLDTSPTPEPSLSVLYGNESRYVRAVKNSVRELVGEGLLRPRDAREIIARARAVDIP